MEVPETPTWGEVFTTQIAEYVDKVAEETKVFPTAESLSVKAQDMFTNYVGEQMELDENALARFTRNANVRRLVSEEFANFANEVAANVEDVPDDEFRDALINTTVDGLLAHINALGDAAIEEYRRLSRPGSRGTSATPAGRTSTTTVGKPGSVVRTQGAPAPLRTTRVNVSTGDSLSNLENIDSNVSLLLMICEFNSKKFDALSYADTLITWIDEQATNDTKDKNIQPFSDFVNDNANGIHEKIRLAFGKLLYFEAMRLLKAAQDLDVDDVTGVKSTELFVHDDVAPINFKTKEEQSEVDFTKLFYFKFSLVCFGSAPTTKNIPERFHDTTILENRVYQGLAKTIFLKLNRTRANWENQLSVVTIGKLAESCNFFTKNLRQGDPGWGIRCSVNFPFVGINKTFVVDMDTVEIVESIKDDYVSNALTVRPEAKKKIIVMSKQSQFRFQEGRPISTVFKRITFMNNAFVAWINSRDGTNLVNYVAQQVPAGQDKRQVIVALGRVLGLNTQGATTFLQLGVFEKSNSNSIVNILLGEEFVYDVDKEKDPVKRLTVGTDEFNTVMETTAQYGYVNGKKVPLPAGSTETYMDIYKSRGVAKVAEKKKGYVTASASSVRTGLNQGLDTDNIQMTNITQIASVLERAPDEGLKTVTNVVINQVSTDNDKVLGLEVNAKQVRAMATEETDAIKAYYKAYKEQTAERKKKFEAERKKEFEASEKRRLGK